MTSTTTGGAASASRPPATQGSSFLARRKRPLGVIALIATALFFITSPLATSQDDASTPVASAATPAPDSTRLELEFIELNDSGVSGTATLYELGNQTLVDLDLDGTGENHPAHIHEGTCETIEPLSAYDLNNVGTDGTSSTLVDVSLSQLLNGDYVIDLHLAPDQLGLLIACADIDGTPVNAEGTPVAVGGDGTPEVTETPGSTETPSSTETPDATTEPDVTPTEAVTPEPTGTGSEETPASTATAEATITPEPTATTDATSTPSDGTGTTINAQTPTAGDGTDGGKGQAVTPLTPAAQAVGGMTSGDGTNADGSTVGSGKGVAVGGASNLPANTGSGDSLILPTTPNGAIVWASAGFAMILLASGWLLRRGEVQRAPSRWRRLGL